HLFDDGLRLGAAAKIMHDRLALDFLPGRIHFETALKEPGRFAGEGVSNRRHNGAGMILCGDPAFAPLAKWASRLRLPEATPAGHRLQVRVPLAVRGADPTWALAIAKDGVTVELAGEFGR